MYGDKWIQIRWLESELSNVNLFPNVLGSERLRKFAHHSGISVLGPRKRGSSEALDVVD